MWLVWLQFQTVKFSFIDWQITACHVICYSPSRPPTVLRLGPRNVLLQVRSPVPPVRNSVSLCRECNESSHTERPRWHIASHSSRPARSNRIINARRIWRRPSIAASEWINGRVRLGCGERQEHAVPPLTLSSTLSVTRTIADILSLSLSLSLSVGLSVCL